MSTDHGHLKSLLGAHVLGGLNETDRHALEAHLQDCDECRDELALFAPLPAMLQRVAYPLKTPEPSRASPQRLDALLRRMRSERASRRRRSRLLALAAAILVMVVAVGALAPWRQAVAPVATSQFSAATGEAATGRAVLTAKPWGTSIAASLAGLPSRGPFVLRVIGVDGRVEQAGAWAGTPTARAEVVGASSMTPSRISAIEVIDSQDRVVATARI